MAHCNLQLDCSYSLFLISQKSETEHNIKELSDKI